LKGCVEQVRGAPDRNFYQEDALRKALRNSLAALRTSEFGTRWFDPWDKHRNTGGEENPRQHFGSLTHTQIHALAQDPSGWWKLAAKSLAEWAAAENNAWEVKPLPPALSELLERELPRRLEADYRHQLQINPEAFRGHALDHFQASAANGRRIIELLQGERPGPAGPAVRQPFTRSLPVVEATLIGREKELAQLDAAWADPKVNTVQVIAPGGTGKTALVDKWFRTRLQENTLGEATAFGWSSRARGPQRIARPRPIPSSPKSSRGSRSTFPKARRCSSKPKLWPAACAKSACC
jgi:hypothetical protein